LVKQELGLTLDGVVISPEIIKCIVELDVNDTFIHHLNELNRKMNFVKQHSARQSQMKAIREVSPELERLRLKVQTLFPLINHFINPL
jgi:hypothetical protein